MAFLEQTQGPFALSLSKGVPGIALALRPAIGASRSETILRGRAKACETCGMPEPDIHDWPLPYETHLAERAASAIDLVVVHCTELPDMAMAREFGERIRHDESQTGNCGHYYIDRDGRMSRFVGDLRVAHHVYRYNPRSIGIELVNLGRYPHWADSRHQAFTEAYTEAQIQSLLALLEHLKRRLPSLQWIAGHDVLDQRTEPASDNPALLLPRRLDPGPMFPWDRVVAASGLRRFVVEPAN